MNIRRIILSLPLLLAAAAPVAEAGNRHVEINVGLGYYLPAHMEYVREVAPVVVYQPAHHGYYQPRYRHHGHDRHHARHCKIRHHNHGRGHHDEDEDDDD